MDPEHDDVGKTNTYKLTNNNDDGPPVHFLCEEFFQSSTFLQIFPHVYFYFVEFFVNLLKWQIQLIYPPRILSLGRESVGR